MSPEDRALTERVCKAVGIEPDKWSYGWRRTGSKSDHVRKVFDLKKTCRREQAADRALGLEVTEIEPSHIDIFTPEGSARVKAAASKVCGWPVTIEDFDTGELEFICWIQTEPVTIQYPWEGDRDANLAATVELSFSAQGRGVRGDTEERAVALAIDRWAQEENQ